MPIIVSSRYTSAYSHDETSWKAVVCIGNRLMWSLPVGGIFFSWYWLLLSFPVRWGNAKHNFGSYSKSVVHFFSVHGLPRLPDVINNGRQFSEEIEESFKTNGIHHRKVTPYWPQANGEVERINRFIKKHIQWARGLVVSSRYSHRWDRGSIPGLIYDIH